MKCFMNKNIKTVQSLQIFKTLNNIQKVQLKKFSCSSRMYSEIIKDETSSSNSVQTNSEVSTKDIDAPYIIPEEHKETVNALKSGDVLYPYKNPFERTHKALMADFKVSGRKILKATTNIEIGDLEVKNFLRHTDILIIGSGPIGISIAYALKTQFPFGPHIIVVDKDVNYPHKSTNLGQGQLLQHQFTEEEEILMSKYCTEFLSTFHRHSGVDGHPRFKVSYEPLGSLVLANESNASDLIKKVEKLREYKMPSQIMEYQDIKANFPWLNLEGVVLGALGLSCEGVFDPWAVMSAMKCKLVNLNVTFTTAEVVEFGPAEDVNIKRVVCRLPDGTYNSIDFSYCIVAAGIESTKIIKLLRKHKETSIDLSLPIEERKRYEYCFHSSNGPGFNTPIVIDPDGTYFRREGLIGLYVAGVPFVTGSESESGLYKIFDERIKPFLLKRIPQLEKIDLVNGWVDTYDYNTANGVGLFGVHPDHKNIIFINGFSQSGLQCIFAVGRGTMEMIYYNEFKTIDFGRYSFENLYRKQHLEAEKKRKMLLEKQERVAISE